MIESGAKHSAQDHLHQIISRRKPGCAGTLQINFTGIAVAPPLIGRKIHPWTFTAPAVTHGFDFDEDDFRAIQSDNIQLPGAAAEVAAQHRHAAIFQKLCGDHFASFSGGGGTFSGAGKDHPATPKAKRFSPN
jgi:hypothetical protein